MDVCRLCDMGFDMTVRHKQTLLKYYVRRYVRSYVRRNQAVWKVSSCELRYPNLTHVLVNWWILGTRIILYVWKNHVFWNVQKPSVPPSRMSWKLQPFYLIAFPHWACPFWPSWPGPISCCHGVDGTGSTEAMLLVHHTSESWELSSELGECLHRCAVVSCGHGRVKHRAQQPWGDRCEREGVSTGDHNNTFL